MSLSGYTQTCALQSGGVKKLYLAIVADVTSFTFSTPDYTAATMASTKCFKEYQFDLDSLEIKQDVTIENKCQKVVHSLVFYLPKLSATLRAALEEFITNSDCGLIAIAEDNNGVKWVLGYSENFVKGRPLYLKTAAGTTGKKLTDGNGVTITLEAEDNEEMRIYTGTVPLTIPTVTTTAITEIAQTTATGGGNVTATGGTTITARGVCWSTSENPTTADSKTTNGSGTGSYVSNLTSLIANTTYYVRAYAINSIGIAYGSQVSFKTLEAE